MNLKLLGVPVLALAAVLAFSSAGWKPASAAGATWDIAVGQGGQGIAANDYFPEDVSVHQGDTVHFANPYLEPHTVTFLPPLMAAPALIVPGPSGPPQFMFNPQAANPTGTGNVTLDASKYYNAGILFKDASADVTFPQQGTFHFICLFHPGMHADVTVVGSGTPVQTQAQLDAAGKADSDQVIANGVAAASQIKSTKQALADGSYNWSVQAGAGAGEADIVQFLSPNITINAGDTVTWTNPTGTPHTVTFLDAGQSLPPLITPLPQASGPPLLTFTAQAFLPAGGATYDGAGYTNSGFFDAVASPSNKYALKFTKPGTYQYHCILHNDQGMMGTITVAGAAAAPQPTPTAAGGVIGAPSTGTGPQGAGPANWLLALLALAIAGAALVLAGTRLVWKRSD